MLLIDVANQRPQSYHIFLKSNSNQTMRLKLYSLLLISTALFFSFSFQSCESSPSKTQKKEKKSVSNKKVLSAADYWATAKANLGLTNKQITGIKAINAKYGKKITSLKKSKKWDGKANDKTRKALTNSKSTEVKKLLGKKYPMYQKFLSKHAIKPAGKKTKGSIKKGKKNKKGGQKSTASKKKNKKGSKK